MNHHPFSRFPLSIAALLLPLGGITLHAQDQTIDGSLTVTEGLKAGTDATSGGAEFRLDGILILKGAFGTGALLSTDQTNGPHLLWYPAKAAFRAGKISNFSNDTLTDSRIGAYSAAFGAAEALGEGSFAAGSFLVLASGNSSVAFGDWAVANGMISRSFGVFSAATGDYSTAIGDSVTASGDWSTALTKGTLASGISSVAMGEYTRAESFAATAIGSYNVGGGDPDEWIGTDPLFEIGNGTGPGVNTQSNAVTVYKNGNMDVQGAITCAPGGDIPMFTGD